MKTKKTHPYKHNVLLLLGVSLLANLFVTFAFSGNAAADPYFDAYEKMNERLPDDDYTLYRNGNAVSSSGDCVVKWGCTTGNYSYFNNAADASSHQYITLGNRSINDDPSVPAAAAYQYANTTEIVVYTWGKPSTPRTLHVNAVDRGIGPNLACKNTITAYYYSGQYEVPSGSSTIDFSNNYAGCNGRDFTNPIPVGAFEELSSGGVGTNIYRAKVVLKYSDASGNDTNAKNTQISFHISVQYGRLGYYGANNSKLPQSKGAEHGWVNTYPTNFARKNKMRFYFRPTCSTAKGTPFSIEWDDVNTGNSSIQPEGAVATLWKYRPGNIGSRQLVQVYSNPGSGYNIRTESTDGYGAGGKQPYAYMVEFDGVYGGNGISFRYPFNSADARTECPPGNSPTPKSECNRFTYSDPGHAIPVGGTVDRKTNSYVHITDSTGRVLVNRSLSYTAPSTGGHLGEGEDGVWDYTPSGETVNIQVLRKYKVLDSNDFISKEDMVFNQTYTCYKPTCNISLSGDGPGGIVVTPGTVHVSAYISNPDRSGALPDILDIPESVYGSHLSLTSDGIERRPGSTVYLGDESNTVNWDIPAMDSRGTQTVNAFPEFWGIGRLGPDCPKSVTVYEYFEIKPTATLKNTNWENPTTVTYETCGSKVTGPDVVAKASSSLTRNGGGVHSAAPNNTYGTNVCNTYTFNPGSITAGDEYCANLTLSSGKGWVDAAGNVVYGEDVPANRDCQKVYNAPYVHFVGSDVSAGGGFGKPCTSNKGGIYTYLNTTGFNQGGEPGIGSGVQIGALAIGPIDGFNSANLRGSAPASANGLAFANTRAVGTGPGDPAVGGNLGGSHCMTNYWEKMPEALKKAGPQNQNQLSLPSTNGKGKQVEYYKPSGGVLRVNNGKIGKGKNVAIFVEGDLRIGGSGSTSKIEYGDTSWTGIEDIPSLYFIVKGNIFIDKEVTQLDGIYIAQPNSDGSGGNIFTCTDTVTPIPTSSLLAECGNQLVVNGAFVAQQVHLLRSFGSLRNSYAGEKLQLGSNRQCVVNTSTKNTNNGDCASEIFNFSPEMYMQAPDIQATSGPNTGKYDYITSLSPVL